jgi:hypothetical protein
MQMKGLAALEPETFKNADLTTLIGKQPYADLHELTNLQMQLRMQDTKQSDKSQNLQHAIGVLKTYNVFNTSTIKLPKVNETSGDTVDKFNEFSGRLLKGMDDWSAANGGKKPTDKDILDIGKGLTGAVKIPRTFLWDKTTVGGALSKEDEAKAVAVMTPGEKSEQRDFLFKRYGFMPNEAQVNQAALLRRLYPNDKDRKRQFDDAMRQLSKQKQDAP